MRSTGSSASAAVIATSNRSASDERTVYALSENPGVDLWTLSVDYPRWLPFVDAVYGSATYLPMADGARYEVSITQSGLIARPLNDAAQDGGGKWK